MGRTNLFAGCIVSGLWLLMRSRSVASTDCNCNSTGTESRSNMTSHKDRRLVIGGANVDLENNEYPYFTRVDVNFLPSCGGSLVSPEIVLTAAHCQPSNVDDFMSVVVNGYHDDLFRRYDDQEIRAIVEMVRHPSFDSSTFDNDLMLLKLNKPVSTIPAVNLDRDTEIPKEEDTVVVIGLGALTEGGAYPDILQAASVRVVNHDECNEAYTSKGVPVNRDVSLCAGTRTGVMDACYGDSGGPLVNHLDQQVGVTSFGLGCGRAGFPGVYARVQAGVDDWLWESICTMTREGLQPEWCADLTESQEEEEVEAKMIELLLTITPTADPSTLSTVTPIGTQTQNPTSPPSTDSPMVAPTVFPTGILDPTESPTVDPTASTAAAPTDVPTQNPTESLTAAPTESPTVDPTASPTAPPTDVPTRSPTEMPRAAPKISPTDAARESIVFDSEIAQRLQPLLFSEGYNVAQWSDTDSYQRCGLERTESQTRAVDATDAELLQYYGLYTLSCATGGESFWSAYSGWDSNDSDPCGDGWTGIKNCTAGRLVSKIDLGSRGKRSNFPRITGSLPAELGLLTRLTNLGVHSGQGLVGTIPTELGRLSDLVNLDLYENALSGFIPTELGLLTDMKTMYFDYNTLSGTIPSELSQLTAIKELFLDHCFLTRRMPQSICDLRRKRGTAFGKLSVDCAEVACSCCNCKK